MKAIKDLATRAVVSALAATDFEPPGMPCSIFSKALADWSQGPQGGGGKEAVPFFFCVARDCTRLLLCTWQKESSISSLLTIRRDHPAMATWGLLPGERRVSRCVWMRDHALQQAEEASCRKDTPRLAPNGGPAFPCLVGLVFFETETTILRKTHMCIAESSATTGSLCRHYCPSWVTITGPGAARFRGIPCSPPLCLSIITRGWVEFVLFQWMDTAGNRAWVETSPSKPLQEVPAPASRVSFAEV